MTDSVQTGWVKPPHQIIGLDHLGVQAPCIQIYSQLLPGITNVTDRARYYSLYPWLLARFEKAGWRSEAQIQTMLRRAECLLTLIGLQHEHSLQDGSDDHRAAMVGVDTLVKAISRVNQGERIAISEYSELAESENRYFANPFGGLGQYYFGALWELGLLGGDSPKAMRLPKGTGTVIAEMVERYVPGDTFIEAIKSDQVDQTLLETLSPFCGCRLKEAAEECEALIGVMLKGWEVLNPVEVASVDEVAANSARSRSLAYLCLLADAAGHSGKSFGLTEFRAMSYSQHDTHGREVSLPDALIETDSYWKVYHRNELLSIALQGLFFATLRAAELSGRRFFDTRSMSDWFWLEGDGTVVIEAIDVDVDTSSAWMKKLANQLPAFSDWNHPAHEIQCMERVSKTTNKNGVKSAELFEIVEDSLRILSAVLFREENQVGYGNIQFPEGYLEYYPVNIDSVVKDWSGQLSSMEIKRALAIFSKNNCLDTHLRVAMRKLRQQGQNTFRFEPGEIAITIKEIPKAAHTTPRFKQAIRILLDLGILERDQSLLRTSQRGNAFVESAL